MLLVFSNLLSVLLLKVPGDPGPGGVLLGDVAVEVERLAAVLLDQVVGQWQPVCEVGVGEARQTERPQTVPPQLRPHQRPGQTRIWRSPSQT